MASTYRALEGQSTRDVTGSIQVGARHRLVLRDGTVLLLFPGARGHWDFLSACMETVDGNDRSFHAVHLWGLGH